MPEVDILVVGGGLAGLIAACETAGAGVSTLLVERAGELGGRARTRRQDGFSFNQGPHAVYAAGALRRTLDDFGLRIEGALAPTKGAKLLWGETFHALPGTPASLLTARPFDLGDRIQLGATLARLSKGQLDGSGLRLTEVTQRLRPRVRGAVEALARLSTYANAPDAMDAEAALKQMRLAFSNVIYLDGGWETMIRDLAGLGRERGAILSVGVGVETLTPTGGAWIAGLSDGRSVTARAVILAADPSSCSHLAPYVPELASAAGRAAPVRAVCLDIGLSRLPVPGNGFALGVDEPLYFSVHSKTARLAPEGGALLHAAWYLAPGEAPAASHLARLEQFADQLQPGWRSLEVARQQLIGITVANDYPRAGLARADVRQAAPAPLYLAGDWVGDEGMLSDASAASACLAARLAIRQLSGG